MEAIYGNDETSRDFEAQLSELDERRAFAAYLADIWLVLAGKWNKRVRMVQNALPKRIFTELAPILSG